jgi:hypothetical protein
VSFASITLCVASQRVFIVAVVYFVIDSVRKLLDTPSNISFAQISSVTLHNPTLQHATSFYFSSNPFHCSIFSYCAAMLWSEE